MAEFERFYSQELYIARKLSKEFAAAHPNVAPMLREKSTDPDVERLLEGVAFLSAQIREKIDDQFPEFVGTLINQFFPHYLRPLPSSVIMAFNPKPSLSETLMVKAGTKLASIPVDGTQCQFQTTAPLQVHPLEITNTAFVKRSVESSYIQVDIKLRGTTVAGLDTNTLLFHIAGPLAQASRVFHLLNRGLSHVEIEAPGAPIYTMTPRCIRPAGYGPDEALLPYPGNAYPAYRILQEYFLLPEKFLFFNLGGLNQWRDRGEGGQFTIRFFIRSLPKNMVEITQDTFVLNAVPAINIFDHDAKPVYLDHKQYQYRVEPDNVDSEHIRAYHIKRVKGYRQGESKARQYAPVNHSRAYAQHAALYEAHSKSSISREGQDLYISMLYNFDDEMPVNETLSITLECTNAHLPEVLAANEISQATSDSPDLLTFGNLSSPSIYKEPPAQGDWMWRLYALLSLNFLSIANADNLKNLLSLYLFLNKGQHISSVSYEKRIDSIESVQVEPMTRMIQGVMMRGQHIVIDCTVQKFLSVGDMFLFGCILDYFFAVYANVNTFTMLTMRDSVTGERYEWPIRMGEQLLI